MPIAGAFRIPLIGGLTAAEKQHATSNRLRPFTVIKPLRMFGACWTSDKVAQRRTVVMCEVCWRKYKGWWKRAEYRPDWGYRYTSDCDGCSTPDCHCTMFAPEETFYQFLGPGHGRQPKP